MLPEFPQINGMQFSKNNKNVLLLTENSANPVCLRVLISEFDDNRETHGNNDLTKFG